MNKLILSPQMMKIFFILLFVAVFSSCKEGTKKTGYPVYKVNLDQADQILPSDLFTRVSAIPLETTAKSHFILGELGVKGERYYILDRNQQLFLCFDQNGKFKYALNNKLKNKDQLKSILNPEAYYYQKKWFYYLMFRNEVYTRDKEGKKHTAYRWDFGPYNDDKETILRFPPLSPQIVAQIQQAWLKANCDFKLSDARQSQNYIYTRLERIFHDSLQATQPTLYHLICHKPTGKCYYFNQFSDGISFTQSVRLEEDCILMLLPWWEKEKFENLAILDAESRQVIQKMKDTDNPILLKWHLKVTNEQAGNLKDKK